jgi:16S rRNA (cytosine1402-N4)-methyltransferase
MAGTVAVHRPVLVAEVVRILAATPPGWIVDCTVGTGGHAAALIEALGSHRVLGIDRDPAQLEVAASRLRPHRARVQLRQGDFRDLGRLVREEGVEEVSGVLYDLGLSSWQLEESGRGFSYRAEEEPLDMRMDPSFPRTAADVLNTYSEAGLRRVFAELGEEPRAAALARAIVRRRPLRTTSDLVAAVLSTYPLGRRRGKHPARRIFQALRMEVNQELPALRESLPQALELLVPGGRLVVIAYHSLEDRVVKGFLREAARAGSLALLSRKPLRPSPEEIGANPRARSARLRAAERR